MTITIKVKILTRISMSKVIIEVELVPLGLGAGVDNNQRPGGVTPLSVVNPLPIYLISGSAQGKGCRPIGRPIGIIIHLIFPRPVQDMTHGIGAAAISRDQRGDIIKAGIVQ